VAQAVAMEWDRLSGPAWIGMDTSTFFFPWYSYLGEQLRSGHIPVWNPHTFGGAPFAADPESGWMYLPAMLAFTLFNPDTAARASLLFHVLLAALSTYALARTLGLNQFGSVLAATVYAHSGFFEGHNVCCYAYADVAAWLPLSLFGAELAMHTTAWRPRLLWSALSGLAFSQIVAAWVGQGSYYAALVLGGFLLWRRARLTTILTTGATIAVWSVALGAAGLLPRLEYNAVSNLPGGYPDAEVSLRATSWADWGVIANWDRLLLQPGFEYIGIPVLVLAVLAAVPLLLTRGKLTYFAVLGVVVLVLARAEPTPLHALFSLLPGFERIHARSPERALIVFYLAPAIIAGLGLSWLTRGAARWRLAASAAVGFAALAIVTLDLHTAWVAQSTESLQGGGDYQFARVDLNAYLAPSPGAQFLTTEAARESPFRYFGYAGHVFGGPMPYTLRWTDPSIAALQVNNRALLTGLDDIQGYNPVHLARYDAFIGALNGQAQNYHHADVFDSGFDSPLLDLLNVRYVVLPAAPASDEVLPHYSRPLQLAYADDSVRIFQNPNAMPRAWLRHRAVQSQTDSTVDFRSVALLEVPPPPLALPPDSSEETVQVVDYAPDRIRFDVHAAAPALMIASEIAYPAWKAYVDGQPAETYVADGALRAVLVGPGDSVVEMRYESLALQVGLALTVGAAGLLVGLAILHFALQLRSRDGSGEVRCKTGAVPQL
jgi:hypothetical protein